MTAPGKTRRSVLWTAEQRLNPPATAGYSRRRSVWPESKREAERCRKPHQRRAPVETVAVDTLDHAALWRSLAAGNDDVLAIVGVVLDLARLRHLDCPDPPVRHGATTHTWHVHAADLIAPGIRGADYRQPKLTERQVAAACNARVAIEQFVVIATVDTPTTPSEA